MTLETAETSVEATAVPSVEDLKARIAALGALDRTSTVPVGEEFVPGIRMDQDWDNAREITATSPADRLLRVRASENEASRWTSVHMVLGPLNLNTIDLLGVVIHSQSAECATVSRVCLRSGNGNKFRDYFFDKHLVSTTEAGVHIDMCRLGDVPEIPRTAEWRDLMIFFSNKEIDISLTKLSVFAA